MEKNVTKYGQTAIVAARYLAAGKYSSPRDAWQQAASEIFPESASAQAKGCPRDAFLSLCELGLIKRVPNGAYTKSVKNKGYIENALSAVDANPRLLQDNKELWRYATNGSGTVHNHQMEVLTALWNAGYLNSLASDLIER